MHEGAKTREEEREEGKKRSKAQDGRRGMRPVLGRRL